MAVNPSLRNAPIVVPKRRVVRVGGEAIGQRESFSVDVKDQGLADIQYLLKAITIAETDQQIAAGNEPTRFAVDSRENKPLANVERRTEVQFGNYIDMVMIRTVQRELINTIRKTTQKRTGALQNIRNWEWVYYERKGQPGRKVNPFKLTALPTGAKLVLRPTERIPYVAWANMKVARRGQDYTPTRGRNKGVTRRTYKGFMAESIAKLKRTQMMRNYTIFVSFSKRFANDRGQKHRYPHGTPTIVVMARRKTRGYRKF